MRFPIFRFFALFVCLILVLAAASCGPQEEQVESGETEAPSSGEDTTQKQEQQTEAPKPTVTVRTEGDAATVTTSEGLVYTATGFSQVEGEKFVFSEGLEIVFSEGLSADAFNRFSLTYSASAPLHVFVTYLNVSDRELTEDYYLEAGEGVFSGLIKGYLDQRNGHSLTRIRIESCKGEAAEFSLCRVKTETIPVYIKSEDDATFFIDNGRFKLGVDMGWGGTINYIEDMTHKDAEMTNLVNKHDTGRLIQQSYYGTGAIEGVFEWGSFNDSEHWPYNPVQGGDKGNKASRLIDVRVGENYVYIKSQPMDWGKVDYITPSYMENTYTLEKDYIRVDNRFVDFSGWEHPFTGQELPALYTVSYLDTFIWYNGSKPWTGDAVSVRDDLEFWGDAQYVGDCTQYLRECNTETWCAWINTADDFGIGLYVPSVDRLKAGRYEYNGSKDADDNATNYVAPYNTMQLVAYEPLEYSYLLTTGTAEQIHAIFTAHKDFSDNASLLEHYISSRLPDVSMDMSDIDFSVKGNELAFMDEHNVGVAYDDAHKAAVLTALGDDPYTYLNYVLSEKEHFAEDFSAIELEYMIPTTNSASSYGMQLFTCTGKQTAATGTMVLNGTLIADGQYHTLRLELTGCAFWQGKINQLRLDFFNSAKAGDAFYLKSFKLIEGKGSGLPSIDLTGEPRLEFATPEYLLFLTNPNGTLVSHSARLQAAELKVADPADVFVSIPFGSFGVEISADTYKTLVIDYVIPTNSSRDTFAADIFLCAGSLTSPSGDARVRVDGFIADGERHTMKVDLSDLTFWSGNIHLIRIDYFDKCAAGDVFYLAAIGLEE